MLQLDTFPRLPLARGLVDVCPVSQPNCGGACRVDVWRVLFKCLLQYCDGVVKVL